MFNIFNNLRLPKIESKTWLRLREVHRWFDLVMWACGALEFKASFDLLRKRIVKFWKSAGVNQLFLYLKEVSRLTVRFLAGQAEPGSLQKGKPLVKRDHRGLPTIIPWKLREILLLFAGGQSNLRVMVVCILTTLSIFRVLPARVRVSLKTIVSPFTGISQTLEFDLIRRALRQLPIGIPRIPKPSLIVIENVSPNASKATWSATLDAVALMLHPQVLWHYAMFALYQVPRGGLWVLWVLVICWFALPIIFVIRLLGGSIKLDVGKLGVVHDQAGKARVVGITNYWIQVLLRPLHNSLYGILRMIPMDGTFDQEGALDRLIGVTPPGQMFHSFDLSAATDRLPVAVQVQVLNALFPGSNLGTMWGSLLGSLTWRYKSKVYKYAVGQPMGAYSSWAMLALSHHVIVQCAAIRVGKFGFTAYCVLGDDIVIADDAVAAEYLVLMNLLGVSINLSKSLQSSLFAEFAKKWKGPNGLILSPIGPGLVLRLVRNKFYLASLFVELFKIRIVHSLPDLLASLNTLPKEFLGQKWNVIWAAFGLNSLLYSGLSQGERSGFPDTLAWCFSAQGDESSIFRYSIYNALLEVIAQDIRESKVKLIGDLQYFLSNFWKTQTSSGWPSRMLEFCLKVLGPGPWAYFYSFIRVENDLGTHLGAVSKGGSWANIQDIARNSDLINVSNIDWRERDKIKASVEFASRLVKAYERSLDDLRIVDGHFY